MVTIENARRNVGMTQSEMAKALGWTKKTYIEYEKYRKYFRVDKAQQFSQTVGMGIEDIVFLPENENISEK